MKILPAQITEFPAGMVEWWEQRATLRSGLMSVVNGVETKEPGDLPVVAVVLLMDGMPEGFIPAIVHLRAYRIIAPPPPSRPEGTQ